MSHRTSRLTTAAAVLAAAAGGGAALAQQPPSAATGTTLTLAAKPTGGSGLDLGRKGVSIGDQFFEHGTLSDAAGHGAGRFQLVTQLVAGSAKHGTEQNEFTLFLAGGQIAVSGGHATSSRFTMPIIGGTGDYTGARGTLSVEPGAHGTERITVQIT